jgi:ribosomal protein L40E
MLQHNGGELLNSAELYNSGETLCTGPAALDGPIALDGPAAPKAIEKIVCRRCFALLEVEDNYCRRCGTPTARVQAAWAAEMDTGASPQLLAPSKSGGKLLESRVTVLTMLFAVLGPLALPLLWRSSRFSLAWKVVLTLLVLLLTGIVVGVFSYVVQMTLAPLKELEQVKGLF